MKITKLCALDVHGYMPLEIEFDQTLTFLTGLNGCGKTSALRLVMALLTPSLDELTTISFSLAELTVVDQGNEIYIRARKTSEGIEISISTIDETLFIPTSELEIYMRRDESRSLIAEKFSATDLYKAIDEMSTPMFLGLDRRFFNNNSSTEEVVEAKRRREYMARRFWPEEPATRRGTIHASLSEVNFLVVSKMQEIRAEQEILDEKLRTQIFEKAFEYKPSKIFDGSIKLPSKSELDQYRNQLEIIEKATVDLKIPVPEIQAALTHFFERMGNVVDSLNMVKTLSKSKKNKKGSDESEAKSHYDDVINNQHFVEWVVNKPQADRVLEHLSLLNQYLEKRTALREPIDRFLKLVNSFLIQTQKEVIISGNGQLGVNISRSKKVRNSISALSSGERQLLVMLAHLSLNSNLIGSGIFIVDEPELSLHIDWQEKFVDAIREANPSAQLILATHSPAIILDRTDFCRSFN